MRTAIFFVLLSFLLSGAPGGHHTRSHPALIFTSIQHNENTKTGRFTHSVQHGIIIRDAGLYTATDHLVTDNIEDEERNNISARKFTSLTGQCTTFSSLLVLNDPHSRIKVSSRFISHSSCKYITQRTLRI